MCRTAGLRTFVAGNIGLPVLDALVEIEQGSAPAPQVWVLELSSFQLETTSSLNADAATVLNLSVKITWIATRTWMPMRRPRRGFLSGNGVQVLNRDDARSLGMALAGSYAW